jgi:transcriptional regulator with XRE-family HTH domain
MKTLSQAITEDREKLGQSQEQVARALGVTQQALSEWEKGNTTPRGPRLRALSQYFGDHSETAFVVEHFLPKSKATFDFPNMVQVPATANRANSYGAPPMGAQTGTGRKEPPREDSPDPQANQNLPPYIPSFESRPPVDVSSDVHEALARAHSGVQLARQVLDDAATQLARALAQIPK